MADWTIAALAEAIRAKKILPVEATREYQTPIEPSPAAGPTPWPAPTSSSSNRPRRQRRCAPCAAPSWRPASPTWWKGGRTPLLPQQDLAEIGYRIVINPNPLTRVFARAGLELLDELKRSSTTAGMLPRMLTHGELWGAIRARRVGRPRAPFRRRHQALGGDASHVRAAPSHRAPRVRPGARRQLLEGPSFDRAGNLYVVDIPNGRVFRISPKGRVPVAA